MINGSMQNGISQLVRNNHFWFNLRNNSNPPDPCTGGSGGGGCSPQAVAALSSQRTASVNTDYTQVLPSNDLDPAISEIIRSLQNSMLFSPNSSQSSTSSDSWMDELDTSSNNYWTDHAHDHSTDDVDNYWMNNPDNYWMYDSEISDESIPFGESEDDQAKLAAAGIEDSPPEVPEPNSSLVFLVFALGIIFRRWKLKGYKQ
ncbi:MAG: hypothetical protein HC916_08645 [Coleofasciculaceae cyanobacterium SM2_1_6]|nr:hypothetical protein [Coleofasciculaceae cyanobacterium SM2_1_6]